MAANDLSAPLGLGKRKFLRLPLGLIGAGFLALLVTTPLVWISLVDDPLGGEPTAVVRLERSLEGVTARDIGVVEIRPSVGADDPVGDSDGDRAAALGPRFEMAPSEGGEAEAESLIRPLSLSIRPDARVIEPGPYGPLPIVSDRGLRPLDVYARPADSSYVSVPKIAIVVGGLGLSQTGTQNAIERLPADMTLAFAPYGASLDRWMQRARQSGHELLLQLPLEPFDFPDNDPGPHTLLVNLDHNQIEDRLAWLLSRLTNYVGVVNYMGARFTSSEDAMSGLLAELNRRGLMFLDDGSSSRSRAGALAEASQTPFAKADVVIDEVPRQEQILSRLLQLEGIARAQGVAVGVASALPVTVDQLADWSRDLEQRGLQLIPVSASIDRAAAPR